MTCGCEPRNLRFGPEADIAAQRAAHLLLAKCDLRLGRFVMIHFEARPYRAALAREQRISSVRPWSRVSFTVSGAIRATLNVDRQGEPKKR